MMASGRGESSALSQAEIFEAIRDLTEEEKTALARIARLNAAKTPYDHGDLFQEAICRVLSGDRTWPRGLPAVVALGGVMRSVAWQWRRRDPASGDTRPPNGPPTDPPQEWKLYFEQLVKSFEDDRVAHAVLLAVMAGYKGRELSAVIERLLNDNPEVQAGGSGKATQIEIERELERVLKKIRRRMNRHRRDMGLL